MKILYARCCCIRSRILQRAIDRALEDAERRAYRRDAGGECDDSGVARTIGEFGG